VAAMLLMILLGVWIFVLVVTNTFGLVEVVGDRIVSGREISLVLGIVPVLFYFVRVFVALRLHKKKFEQAILNSLENIDPENLYSVL
jgi:Ca2+/H+ antiporter